MIYGIVESITRHDFRSLYFASRQIRLYHRSEILIYIKGEIIYVIWTQDIQMNQDIEGIILDYYWSHKIYILKLRMHVELHDLFLKRVLRKFLWNMRRIFYEEVF